jgi:hypothetical protein
MAPLFTIDAVNTGKVVYKMITLPVSYAKTVIGRGLAGVWQGFGRVNVTAIRVAD